MKISCGNSVLSDDDTLDNDTLTWYGMIGMITILIYYVMYMVPQNEHGITILNVQ